MHLTLNTLYSSLRMALDTQNQPAWLRLARCSTFPTAPRIRTEDGSWPTSWPLNEAARDPEFLNSLPFNELYVELTESAGGRAWPRIPVLEQYKTEIRRLQDEVIHGQIDPQQGLDDMTAKLQQELIDFRQQVG